MCCHLTCVVVKLKDELFMQKKKYYCKNKQQEERTQL